jgi:hypothetical protein
VARCEDGSAPALVGDETFECQDGSEPSCEDGSSYMVSSDGSTLLCGASLPSESGTEEHCEVGSTAGCGSTPGGCTAAEQPESDGSSSCEADGEPGEAEGSSGADAQRPVGSRKHDASAS